MKQKETQTYRYPLKMDGRLKDTIKKLAKANRRSLNEELNVAIELYVNQNKDKSK